MAGIDLDSMRRREAYRNSSRAVDSGPWEVDGFAQMYIDCKASEYAKCLLVLSMAVLCVNATSVLFVQY